MSSRRSASLLAMLPFVSCLLFASYIQYTQCTVIDRPSFNSINRRLFALPNPNTDADNSDATYPGNDVYQWVSATNDDTVKNNGFPTVDMPLPRKRSSIMLGRLRAALASMDRPQVSPRNDHSTTTEMDINQPIAMALSGVPSRTSGGRNHNLKSSQLSVNAGHRRGITSENEALMKCYFNPVACF